MVSLTRIPSLADEIEALIKSREDILTDGMDELQSMREYLANFKGRTIPKARLSNLGAQRAEEFEGAAEPAGKNEDQVLAHQAAPYVKNFEAAPTVSDSKLKGCPLTADEMRRIFNEAGGRVKGRYVLLCALGRLVPENTIIKPLAAQWFRDAGITNTDPRFFKKTIRRTIDEHLDEWERTAGGHRKYIGN